MGAEVLKGEGKRILKVTLTITNSEVTKHAILPAVIERVSPVSFVEIKNYAGNLGGLCRDGKIELWGSVEDAEP